ncbi:hypothetical protein ACRE1S_03355 [Helicobacter himalayensis]|uniref:hypothetical protein n=1 Tax=Helicobacter himalayensis TaxID=1591088 RepID=UPI003D6DB2CC
MKITDNIVSVISSCLFFALFCWVSVTLLGSRFLETFSYIFFIFIREHGVFVWLTNFILFCGALLSIVFLVLGSKKFEFILHALIVCFCIGFVYIIVLTSNAPMPDKQDITSLLLIESSIDHRGMAESILDYKTRILASGFVYIFFIFLPLGLHLFCVVPNTKTTIGALLEMLKPSLNVVVMALFACALQPFYLKTNFYDYLDLLCFIVGFVILIFTLWRQKPKLNFYGMSNVVLLCLGVVFVLLCSNILASSDQYFNVRYTLYAFVFVVWYAEWAYSYITRT